VIFRQPANLFWASCTMRNVALCVLVGAQVAFAAVELTEKTWAGATEGKNAFVKFLAPW